MSRWRPYRLNPPTRLPTVYRKPNFIDQSSYICLWIVVVSALVSILTRIWSYL